MIASLSISVDDVFGEGTYTTSSFEVSGKAPSPYDFEFNSDGTKVFVVDDFWNKVFEYDLSTGFDISTMSYSQEFSLHTDNANAQGLNFNPDGTKMFVVDRLDKSVYQYDLSTGFDISTAVINAGATTSVSLSSFPQGIEFNGDGTKMYITPSLNNDDVFIYTLTTGYDLSTASFTTSHGMSDNLYYDLGFNSDGTKFYTINTIAKLKQYSLSTAYDLTTQNYDGEFDFTAEVTSSTAAFAFNSDGSKFYGMDLSGVNKEIFEYDVNPAFDLISVAPTESSDDSDSDSGGGGCADCTPPTLGVNSDGTRLVENGFAYNGDAIDVESFYTPFDLLTVEIGRENIVELKIYENSGADSIQHIGLSFGLDRGQIFGEGLAIIEWDKVYGEDPKITVTDPENVLDNVRVVADPNLVKCTDDSITEQCMKFRIYHSFREGPDFRIFSTYIWDDERNGWQNYFNHGLNVVGESLNPPDVHTVFDRQGYLYTITVTGDRQAVDGNGDRWYLDDDEFWKKEFFVKRPPVQGVPMAGYDKDHPYFTAYQDGQVILAENTLKAILGVDSIQSVLPDYTPGVVSTNDDSKLDKEMTDKMKLEEIKAFEKMYANYYNSGQHDGRFAFTEPSSESGFGGGIVIQNDNSQELMGVIGLMVGLIAVSVVVGFYSIRK